ncbi:ABC transporter permease [Demequina zhanjiangensis]|uniref:Transport permease protein n=1 Tax=Demequina zhanjiangensis TaxID=3051659 RepID=A0ABT8G505_9MICO|nr:ABC transporter permease [Demequina sp. SYSU T00b26]MDN4473794.1 ABC transporter permease [Demequina sp. SYSU T00b26]
MTTEGLSAYAEQAGLERVGARPKLRRYIVEAWRRRELAATLASYRIHAAMGQNRLGLVWIVLRPTLLALMFGTIFFVILPNSSRPDNFLPFLVVGVFVFEFFSASLGQGARSIINNQGLVRSLNFPRILMPMATVLQRVFEIIPVAITMMVIVALSGEPITWNWLLVPVVLAIMAVFNFGIALIFARLTVHLRDLTQVLPLLTRLMFYSTGIFYSIEAVLADRPDLLALARLNPVYDYIALVRAQIVTGNSQTMEMWIVAVAAALLCFIIGVIFFWRAEERYGRD